MVRAAAGSRYSSTNLTVTLPTGARREPALRSGPRPQRRLRREVAHLVVVDAAQLLDEVEGAGRLLLVDLRHGEADVDQDPVADLDAAGVAHDQADVDLTPHTVDIDRRPLVGRVHDLDDLAGNPETHQQTSN